MTHETSVNPKLAELVTRIILESGHDEIIGLLIDHCSLTDLKLVHHRLILERDGRAEKTDLSKRLGSEEYLEVLKLAILRGEAGICHESIGIPYQRKVWNRVRARISSRQNAKER